MTTSQKHTVHPLGVSILLGRLTAITGVSGSGKTTMILESLVPALKAQLSADVPMSDHVTSIDSPKGLTVDVVDATPIGINVRSTVATYSGVMDELRKAYAETSEAQSDGLTASDFSNNTGSLSCTRCDGTGEVSLDVQFLPDVDIVCPECEGGRFLPAADKYKRNGVSLPQLLRMTVAEAEELTSVLPKVRRKLQELGNLGLGYLVLGQATPALSVGEVQRLKLVSHMRGRKSQGLVVLDEPSVGLHPLDVRTLLEVLRKLTDRGITVVVIEHDLDLIANADYVIDMGPGGGEQGGRVVATGTPEQIANHHDSITGKYLAQHPEYGAR